MSKELLIVNAERAVSGTATTYAEIQGGQLGIIEDGAIAAELSGTAEAVLSVGKQTSVPFKPEEVVRAIKVAPNAGTTGTGTVDFTNADAEEPTYVKLINTTIGTMDNAIKSFEAATLAAVVAAINADGGDESSPFYGFSASLGGNTITVTAPINSTFRLAATDGCVIAYPQAAVPSRGLATDIADLEENLLYAQGITNKVGFPVTKPASKVVDGAQYVQYIYEIARQVPNKAGTGTVGVENNTIVLAVKSDLSVLIGILDGDAVVED